MVITCGLIFMPRVSFMAFEDMNSIDLFIKNWGSKHTMVPIATQDITCLEEQLDAFLPDSFKYLISTYGLVHTPNVLTRICDLGVDVSEVQDFLNLDDINALSKLYEMSGMPKGHILFASDCKGNMFCFKRDDCLIKRKDAPIWFYHHDLGTIEKVANSFTQWIQQFNDL